MRNLVPFLGALLFPLVFLGQMKIGANPAVINPNSILEIESANKGVLLPRLSLIATNNTSPLTAFVSGMLVYNTATSGSGSTAVTPGMYYSDGTKWVRLEVNASSSPFWGLTGNAGTNASTHFLGTTDNVPLAFKTNNNEAVRILANGKVGIGTTLPSSELDVNGQVKIRTVNSGASTDSLLVLGSADNVVKKIDAGSFVKGVQKKLDIVAVNGQQTFTTPATITDSNKVMLYRNGVLIDFTVSGVNTIQAEVASVNGDEIRIVQIL